MARYQIKEDRAVVSVEVTEIGEQQEQLLEAFGACQSGQCACPTDEYEKLASLAIEETGDSIQLRLEPKADEHIDLAQIDACLRYTTLALSKETGKESVSPSE